jgi:GPH family glycoside/pentoside/hexuronide:cation symporter
MTPRLDLRTKILYGIGDVANGIKMVVFGLFTLFFYTSVMGLPSSWVGAASLIALLWNAAIDPYVGYVSDKARFRFGRRHSFMLVGALSMGITFWAFLSPPRGLSPPILLLWLLVTSLLVRTATTVYGVPYYALGAELCDDYHERTSVTAIRGLLALLGTLAAASLSFLAFFPDRHPGMDPKLDYSGYPAMGLAFGLTMTIAGVVATLGTLSRRPYLPARGTAAFPHRSHGFSVGIVQCLRNPSFLVLFASFSLFFLGVVINSSLSLYYLTYYAHITASAAVSGFQVSFYAGGLAGVGSCLALARFVEKRRLCLFAALATATVMWGALLLVGEGRPFGTGNVRPLVIGHGLAGLLGSVLWFIPGSMIADVADEDELVTGHRREGAFFGIFFLGQQVAASVSSLVTGVSLEWFAGLVPGRAEQSALTISRIGVLYAGVPAVLVMAAAALMWRYALTRARVASIQAELARRRLDGRPPKVTDRMTEETDGVPRVGGAAIGRPSSV